MIRPRCGSRDRFHVATECLACGSIHDRDSYEIRRTKIRKRRTAAIAAGVAKDAIEAARVRARVWKKIPPAEKVPRHCCDANCGEERLHLVIEDADIGPQWQFACRKHKAQAQRELANRVYELMETPKTTLAAPVKPRMTFEEATIALRRFPAAVQEEIKRRATQALGLTLSEEAPLFRSRFVALVIQAVDALANQS